MSNYWTPTHQPFPDQPAHLGPLVATRKMQGPMSKLIGKMLKGPKVKVKMRGHGKTIHANQNVHITHRKIGY